MDSYNPYSDLTLFKLWGFAPLTLGYSIYESIAEGEIEPLRVHFVGWEEFHKTYILIDEPANES